MTTTEQTVERTKQIRSQIAAIAPYPSNAEDVTAASLARHLAVRAQVIHQQILHPDGELAPYSVNLVTLLFAAAHALYEVADLEFGDGLAREIWKAWEDGEGVAELLWRHLGDETAAEVSVLADEFMTLKPPAEGLLAHSQTIRRALERAAMEAPAGVRREPYLEALAALDREASKTS